MDENGYRIGGMYGAGDGGRPAEVGGLPVSVVLLCRNGEWLSGAEYEAAAKAPHTGEAYLWRVKPGSTSVTYQSVLTLFVGGQPYLRLFNPQNLPWDSRGIRQGGNEVVIIDGRPTEFRQVWLINPLPAAPPA
ncbi:MAG TPA: hypothetical protein VIT92_14505 [Burkholderiaceae bacterium]